MPLNEREAGDDPLALFRRWFSAAEAEAAAPEAVALGTATPDGRPSVRMVLVKAVDERGVAFHTSYASRKARELEANPRAALAFYWPALGRQVRVEGRVERVTRAESEAYFRTRPRESRLAAWGSRQSAELDDRAELDAAFARARSRFPADVPLPDWWGGYRLVPEAWEFWARGEHRLHDRLRYTRRPDGGWRRARLSP